MRVAVGVRVGVSVGEALLVGESTAATVLTGVGVRVGVSARVTVGVAVRVSVGEPLKAAGDDAVRVGVKESAVKKLEVGRAVGETTILALSTISVSSITGVADADVDWRWLFIYTTIIVANKNTAPTMAKSTLGFILFKPSFSFPVNLRFNF